MIRSTREQNVELKYFYSPATGNATSTPTVACISAITQGVAANQRTGDEANLKTLQFNIGFTGGDATNYVRATIVRWLMNDSNDAVTASDVFTNSSVAWLSLASQHKPNRFEMVWDKTAIIGTGGTDGVIFKGSLKTDWELAFNSTAITGINHLYVIISSDSSAATHPVYTFEMEVGYTDA